MSWKRKALLYRYSRETQGIGSRNQLRQRELVGNVPEASGASLGHLTLAQILKVTRQRKATSSLLDKKGNLQSSEGSPGITSCEQTTIESVS